MCTTTVPATAAEALDMLESAAGVQECALGFLAAQDAAALPAQAVADQLRALERHDAIEAAVRARLLEVFDTQDGHLADGQRSTRSWLVHSTRVTKGQAAEYQAVQALARGHQVLLAALAEGCVLTKSVALQLARWTKAIPEEYRGTAEEILVAAARAGVDLRGLAAICAEIRACTAQPDPDGDDDPRLDRGVSLDTTFDGAGVVRGDLSPGVRGDGPGGPGRPVGPRRRRGPADPPPALPRRAGRGDAPPPRLQICSRSGPGSRSRPWSTSASPTCASSTPTPASRTRWIGEYRARWAAHRAAASVSTGDGGAWLDGDAARQVACDAMIIPVVTGDIDPGAVDELIALCVGYHQLRTQAAPAGPAAPIPLPPPPPPPPPPPRLPAPAPDAAVPAGLTSSTARHADQAAAVADALAEMEHQILAKILQVVSGPGGAASFLRRHLLGKPLAGPSLPLDVGQTDDIPLHLRRLVALRDQTCQFAGGCDQPAASLRTPPRHPPRRRRPHQPHQPQGLLLVASSRGPARTRLDPDRPPRRHQPGPEPRRQDHPQPQPPTPTPGNHPRPQACIVTSSISSCWTSGDSATVWCTCVTASRTTGSGGSRR